MLQHMIASHLEQIQDPGSALCLDMSYNAIVGGGLARLTSVAIGQLLNGLSGCRRMQE